MPVRTAINIFWIALFAALTSGCATRNYYTTPTVIPDNGSDPTAFLRAEQTMKHLFPPQYQATHRAIITTGGKQFTCDGLLQVSPTEGHHLAIVSSFGVVTDLRVKANGDCELLKITPLFRENWSRRFVARDLHWLFNAPPNLRAAGRLANGDVVLQTTPDSTGVTARYIFSADGARWLELDLLLDGKSFYRAVPKNYHKYPGATAEIPSAFEINAEAYQLELRIAGLTVAKESHP